MWLKVLWRRWFGRSRPFPLHDSRRTVRQRPCLRPHLEALEDRTLLTGSLPYPIATTYTQLAADIQAANTNGGSNTITLGANIQLTSVDNTTNGANGLPVITAGDQLTIDGNGYSIARSTSAPAFRFLDVASGASLTLQNVTLSNGLAQGTGTAAEGGAVFSTGTLLLQNDVVEGNYAQGVSGAAGTTNQPNGGAGQNAAGGGIFVSGGSVTLEQNTVLGKNFVYGGAGGTAQKAKQGGTGGTAQGGALSAINSTVVVDGATFASNLAIGGRGGQGGGGAGVGGAGGVGGNALGGGIYTSGGTVQVSNATFGATTLSESYGLYGPNYAGAGSGGLGGTGTGAFPQGGQGGQGGTGAGGALYANGGTVTLDTDNFSGNSVAGGRGGSGKSIPYGTEGAFGGAGGSGGTGDGGAVAFSGATVTLTNATLSYSGVSGGSGGTGGTGGVIGGAGGAGGNASGGAIFSSGGSLSLSGDTLQTNSAGAGQGGLGGNGIGDKTTRYGGIGALGGRGGQGGTAFGGAIYVLNTTLTVTATTESGGSAYGGGGGFGGQDLATSHGSDGAGAGGNGGQAQGGGIYSNGGSVSITNASLTNNEARGGGGGVGATQAAGYFFQFLGIGAGGNGNSGSGGGLFSAGGTVTLNDVSVSSNIVYGGSGGWGGRGVAGEGGYGGTGGAGASASGGGIEATGGTVSLTGVTLSNNHLYGGNGGSGGSGSNGRGGNGGGGGSVSGAGLFVAAGNVTVSGGTVSANILQAGRGGKNGGYIGTTFAGGGGTSGQDVVVASGANLTLSNIRLSGDSANVGGAIYNAGTLTLTGDTLNNDSATTNGGALYNAGTATLNNDTLSGDSASVGGAIYNLGTLTLNGGTLSGNSASEGGAIYNQGTLLLSGTTIADNTVQGVNGVVGTANSKNGGNGQTALGGGIYSASGTVTLEAGAVLESNQALGGKGGGVGGAGGNGGSGANAFGGGLYLAGGVLNITDATVAHNLARGGAGGFGGNGVLTVHGLSAGGNGGNGGSAFGGGLYVVTGTVSVNNTTLDSNTAEAGGGGGGVNIFFNPKVGIGGSGGSASGGGLYLAAGNLILNGDTLTNDNALAGNGGVGGFEESFYGTGGKGGRGGDATGGGLYLVTGVVSLSGDTLASDRAQAGNGGTGGGDNGSFGHGGKGGFGGNASGGGLYLAAATLSLNNNTLVNDQALGGGGGAGGVDFFAQFSNGISGITGSGSGGGLSINGGSAALLNLTVANNLAQSGTTGYDQYVALTHTSILGSRYVLFSGGNASGGGLYVGSGSVTLANTLLAGNTVTAFDLPYITYPPGTASGPDVYGTVASSDHDLIGNSSGSTGFSTAHGDILDPSSAGLDPNGLQNNGGPTPTLALVTGSPAIDAGDSSVPGLPATDQRGYARIVGGAIDIGAYESGATPAVGDLAVSGSAPATTFASDQVTYTITVTNQGTSPQSNVVLSDLLPDNTTLVSWTAPQGWSSSAPAVGSSSGTVTAWTTSLAAGASASFTLVVQVNNTVASGTVLTNTASVGPFTGDPNPANNTVTLTTTAGSLGDKLAAEIAADNQTGGSHTITLLPNFTYVLTSANNTTNAATGLPIIAAGDNLTIIGNGATIERSTAYGTPAFRLFDVAAGASLTLENLTLSHGLAVTGTGNPSAEGGAVYSSGNLTVSGVTVRSNTAQAVTPARQAYAPNGNGLGGGLYVGKGTVTLQNDTFYANHVYGGGSANTFGGGVYVAGGTVAISNVTVNDNSAFGGTSGSGFTGNAAGGGLYLAGGTITLTNDTVSGNLVTGGGGVSPNSSASGGGLAVAGGNVTLRNDTFNGNTVQGAFGSGGRFVSGDAGNGGGGGNAFGGGLDVTAGNIILINDTISSNSVYGGTGGNGGYGYGGKGGNGGNGGSASGGGLYVAGLGVVSLINDTLSNNTAQGGSGGQGGYSLNTSYARIGAGNSGNGGDSSGGGLSIGSGATITLANTLIAENSIAPGTGAPALTGSISSGMAGNPGNVSGPDVSGTVTSSDHDLIGNSSGFSATTSTGDILDPNSASLGLGTLANNGGPTQTIALQAGSLAIDAGDSHAAGLTSTDQRGYARIAGNAIDIGANEYNATPATTDLSIRVNAASTAAAGSQITYTLTVTNNSSTAQSNVTLVDGLPANTTLASWSAPSGWSSDAPSAGSSSGTVSAWISSLAGNTSATFTLVVQVNSTTAPGTVITDAASVGPITGDANPANNSATTSTTVTAATSTVTNVSNDVSLTRGGFRYDFTTHEIVQTITIKNTSGSTLFGPLAVQLTNLPGNVALANATNTNNGDPYIDFVSPNGQLAAGQSITVTLYFKDPTSQAITYGTQVWQGL